ncbi:IclR family transcriptional regulator [Microvirga sp. KLBC 81]|uniref:IclR family transcriptional regulator n=1 Tax=Microvirga sp. KLBC 81 TaxID=1862707 RepID=UPI000D512422|nr:IclR family transcriptional regulator [Microvirga sp. KLBC 81]PVE21394.1 IclR family transcriptional regulator [Microvirga sp. KLBC 81]
MSDIAQDAENKHTIPAIDRMMEVLEALEHSNGTALTIRELTDRLDLPRTAVYRILNTLQRHEIVHRDKAGAYSLGRRLLTLASHVASRASDFDIAAFSQPFLDRLSADLGEGVKLSVIDEEGIIVVAASQGRREYALTVKPGQRMPVHASAASKLLLSHVEPQDLDQWLADPLPAYTSKTITDPKRLRAELARIKRLGWAQDKGESAPSIYAFAAPVFFKTGRLAAAVSVPFLAGAEPSRMEEIRMAAIDTGRAISDAMPT